MCGDEGVTRIRVLRAWLASPVSDKPQALKIRKGLQLCPADACALQGKQRFRFGSSWASRFCLCSCSHVESHLGTTNVRHAAAGGLLPAASSLFLPVLSTSVSLCPCFALRRDLGCGGFGAGFAAGSQRFLSRSPPGGSGKLFKPRARAFSQAQVTPSGGAKGQACREFLRDFSIDQQPVLPALLRPPTVCRSPHGSQDRDRHYTLLSSWAGLSLCWSHGGRIASGVFVWVSGFLLLSQSSAHC